VVNLLTAGQVEAARQRVLEGRKLPRGVGCRHTRGAEVRTGRGRLAPLEADLQKSTEVLQDVEHSLGFAPRI
jgi:hypothetical protein